MLKKSLLTGLISFASVPVLLATSASAQQQFRQGVMQSEQMNVLQAEPTTLSSGTLLQLRSDSNFVGNFSAIVRDASVILEGYTVVARGGYFPENEGIPRDRQLTVDQVVYRMYQLENGSELVLFRTPRTDTAQYFIRRLQAQRQRLG